MSEEKNEIEGKGTDVQIDKTGELTKDDKLWGMLSHILVFCSIIGVPIGNILAPLMIMLIQKDKSDYVVDNAKESLNFQISYTVYAIGAVLLCIVLIGFILLIPLIIAWIVFPIIAGIKANEGEKYKYPYIFRLVS